MADWWPLVSAPQDYAEEAEEYCRALIDAAEIEVREVLELGSGGGNNASHMKAAFELTLVDASTGMLDVSRRLNPECEHVVGDMRTVRLDRAFDAVFVHDAVMYMATPSDLRRAMETAWAHLRPGGVALFAPDHVRETFRPGTSHGGHDGPARSVRYLEWTWDPDPADTTFTVDYVFVLRDGSGDVTVEHDRHVVGVFHRQYWLDTLEDVGFEAEVRAAEHSELEPGDREVFVAKRV